MDPKTTLLRSWLAGRWDGLRLAKTPRCDCNIKMKAQFTYRRRKKTYVSSLPLAKPLSLTRRCPPSLRRRERCLSVDLSLWTSARCPAYGRYRHRPLDLHPVPVRALLMKTLTRSVVVSRILPIDEPPQLRPLPLLGQLQRLQACLPVPVHLRDAKSGRWDINRLIVRSTVPYLDQLFCRARRRKRRRPSSSSSSPPLASSFPSSPGF